MINEEIVLNYENFIHIICRRLDSLLFPENTMKNEDENSENIRKINDERKSNVEFVKVNDNKEILQFNMKNSHVIHVIFKHKVIDILIFLVLRHFNLLIKEYDFTRKEDKKVSEKKNKKEDEKKNKFNFQFNEVETKCGKLLKPLIDFLYKCVYSMTTQDNV
jgi:hypothetical protein